MNLEQLTGSLEKVGNFLKNFDNLGAFALGAYAVDGNQVRRLIEGLKVLISYNLAKSPNIPASVVGIGTMGLTFQRAVTKSSSGDKKWYELN